jgi:hypothetical protein
MTWWQTWLICGALTFLVMWYIDYRNGRKFVFIDRESIYNKKIQIIVVLVVFILGPIGLAFTLFEIFGDD